MIFEPEFQLLTAIIVLATALSWRGLWRDLRNATVGSLAARPVAKAPVARRASARLTSLRTQMANAATRAFKGNDSALSRANINRPSRAKKLLPTVRRSLDADFTFGRSLPSVSAPPATALLAAPRLGMAAQVERIGEIVMRSVDRANLAATLQKRAAEELDSAHYALQNALDELSAVMPVGAYRACLTPGLLPREVSPPLSTAWSVAA